MINSNFESSRVNKSPWYFRPENLILLIPAGLKFFIHILAINGYGLGGDELYYLACSDHLDWGYVDQPPFSLFLLHIQRVLFGDSVLSIRLLPALCGFFTILLTGLLARRMGAGIFGQLLAECCALIAPVYLALNHIFSMNAFDVLFWLAALYLMVCIIDGGKSTLWVWLGLVLGLGFENKISVLFLGFGLVVGLMMTKQRRLLVTRWIWPGAIVAALLMLPNIIWEINNDWPTIEWINNARTHKMVALSLPSFLFEQIILMQPLTLLIWGTGLISLLVHPALERYRSLGWCYLAVLAVIVLQGGKPYYLAPIYPPLFVAGAIAIERWLTREWMRNAIVMVILVVGTLTAPLGMPLLPVESFITYSNAIGLRPSSGERYAEGKLPSFFANMFGWQKLVATVDTVYRSLSSEDQCACGIFCQNYMQAGAVDFYGRQCGLPSAISGHNNYWLWGMKGYTGDVMIVIGSNAKDVQKYFEEVTERARFRDEYIQPIHNDLPIFLVRKPKYPLAALWPGVKEYI
jgi:Dolichyl-phosphate-mannose-protein mannosyltransferase